MVRGILIINGNCPEENTIDFQIFTQKDNNGRDEIMLMLFKRTMDLEMIEKYKKVNLVVSYDESKDDTIDYSFKMLLESSDPKRRFSKKKFNHRGSDKDYGMTSIRLENNKMICEKDKEEIQNRDIVEMRYVQDTNNDIQWIPIRIRKDKQHPQAEWVANNVWSTITNPITTEMIRGKYDIQRKVDEQVQRYYLEDSNKTTSGPLRSFHNYIKSELIQGTIRMFPNRLNYGYIDWTRRDAFKYMEPNVQFLFGLDIAPVDVASKRFYMKSSKKSPAVFIRYDTSKSIVGGDGYVGSI